MEKLEEDDQEDEGIIKSFSLKFRDSEIEKAFHIQMDRWFIPALAISIFFLVVYGLYQVLVMPRLITSLALIVVALTVMFVILLMLYVNYFEVRRGDGIEVLEFLPIYYKNFSGSFNSDFVDSSPVVHVWDC